MIALAILALVLVMIAGAFNVVIHSKVHGEARLDTDRQGRAILWQLSNEIRGAVQTPNPQSNVLLIGLGQMRSGAPVDAITVSTLQAGHRRAITGIDAEEVVSYSVSPNPRVRGWYVLSRNQWSALMGHKWGLGDAADRTGRQRDGATYQVLQRRRLAGELGFDGAAAADAVAAGGVD